MRVTTTTITTGQVEALMQEAAQAGDDEMVRLCREALPAAETVMRTTERAESALEQVVEAINAAEAMEDEE